jgi:isoleucyl-tRNA synthetase
MKENMKKHLLKPVDNHVDFAGLETTVLDYWDEINAFERSVQERPADKPFVFYDGPPFATGLPHYGHIVASTTKDVIPRYWTMKGYRVERQWGWDCHGLPIENIVEQELNLGDKQAIEAYGIEAFNQACRTTVLRYVNEWKTVIRRLGRWVDMEHDYKTMESWYMESLWWVFKQLWERQLIYQGHKSMHLCPRCSTTLSNFEVTQGYKDVKDISLFVTFPVTNAKDHLGISQPVSLIAWTTTPWTLPGNLLVAVKPDIDYTLFTLEASDTIYIAATSLIAQFVDSEYTVVKTVTGDKLAGLTYTPLFPYFQSTPNAFKVVTADFVTTQEGSGMVHIAPAFGEDDYQLGLREQVPFIQPVGIDGKFTNEVADFAGLPVKPKDNPTVTDVAILRHLQERGLVFKKQTYLHSYPHCWRCDTPLINYATGSWFLKVTAIKDQLLKNNQKITWLPSHIQTGRFGKWLEGARDWAISRSRYWGTPLPVWESASGERICIGSKAELESYTGTTIDDLHKEIIDRLVIVKDGEEYRRIPEVLDCWFESGAMPYASFHYPFDNKARFEQSFPAEFISEGQDQTRGWFYTLHVLATALTTGDNPAIPVPETTSSFKNCVVTGIVLAEDGKKMSKKLKNYPDPMEVANRYGMDALRFYLMSSPVMKAENLNFSEKGVVDTKRKVFNLLWNVFQFYRLFDNGQAEYGYPAKAKHVLDQWLVSRSQELISAVTSNLDAYDIIAATRELADFIQELSTWYVRRSRDRLRTQDPESLQVLRTVLRDYCLLMAPLAPFITELIYQQLPERQRDSIHLDSWPQERQELIQPDLNTNMAEIRHAIEKAHSIRKTTGLPIRQPLASATITSTLAAPAQALQDLVAEEVNVKTVVWNQGEELMVTLDTHVTDELKAEGEARELIRKILDERKRLQTNRNEPIIVEIPHWPLEFTEQIKQKVLAKEIRQGESFKVIRK